MTRAHTKQLLASLGVSYDTRRSLELEGWDCYSLNHASKSRNTPILIVDGGQSGKAPKTVTDLKRVVRRFPSCVILASGLKKLLIRTPDKTHMVSLDSDAEYSRIAKILEANNVGDAKNNIELIARLEDSIDAIPSTTYDFENRGLFSTHYLRNRVFDDASGSEGAIKALRDAGTDAQSLLKALGWRKTSEPRSGTVHVIVTDQENFSIRESRDDVVPSYRAVSALSKHRWVILTNGAKWRLYTSRVSASTTNYFELNLAEPSDTVLQYLYIIFGYASYAGKSPRIDLFFDQGKEFATQLEENLSERIMSQDGVLLNLAKGILNHNMKTVFDAEELASAKEAALRIIYRVWFVAYAESRNLLPISDKKYAANMSLRGLRGKLDMHEEQDGDSCWKHLLKMFAGIRDGSPENNLPQYNGNLFRHDPDIDRMSIQNRWLVPALRDLLEHNGDTIDYASLGVRHLGNILESVMEFSIQQAKKDVMLLVKGHKIVQVRASRESNYSYKKNDLYLASKGGLAMRKGTGSYYTPDEIVKFLVRRGLEPILADRSSKIGRDVASYAKNPTPENRDACMEHLLDIQVLDPAMGSGHFLVEALNQLTSWATETMKKHPKHPLLEELEVDRKTVVDEQEKMGVSIDLNLLTHDVLLKRKIMKRCIFGVDSNPTATEIAKLALWLDSFAIGVPFTYMDHHIRTGDSTIGVSLDDLNGVKNQSLDDWMPGEESNAMLEDVSTSPDITVSQVRRSEALYEKYAESVSNTKRVLDAFAASIIDDTMLPKKSGMEFVHRFGRYGKNEDKTIRDARRKVSEIAERRRFFHWELEMRDAFTDARHGFDVIIGNPPWDKIKPFDDEFFTPYYPAFKSLPTKAKKEEIMDILLQNDEIKTEYELYKKSFLEKTNFYSTASTYQMQGSDARDLSKLILERTFQLLSENGVISMVIPSQVLASSGSTDIRQEILNKEIIQLYVFENKGKIFDIHSSYRFMLLTLRNSKTKKDEFPVGFYLHHLSSLIDHTIEKEKFGKHSKIKIREMFPETLTIPENMYNTSDILVKLYKHPKLADALSEDGMSISFADGFRKTDDSKLFREDGRGWSIHEGKTIHQYNHTWSRPMFTAQSRAGLKREDKPKYAKKHREFYNSYRLVFRDVSGPTNMRTTIATIIPPKTFHTYALRSVLIKRDGTLLLDDAYIRTMVYLCGVFNSTTFDFISRQIIQVHLSTLISDISIPNKYKNEISNLAAKLLVGHTDFAGLAETMHIPNRYLTVADRIDIAARLDVIVAKAYGIDKQEYKTILESFKLFRENPDLWNEKEIIWDNSNLKEFYGEMRKKALEIFDDVK